MDHPERPLLVHDGELADVCELLAELGLPFVEAPTHATDATTYYSASLVIAGPQYLIQRLDDVEEVHPTRIVVMTSEARSVRSLLVRSGIDWIVRRPVHPTALRLFVLHCLFRGREKRGTRRVSIGSEIQLRTRWRRRTVLLAEISRRDCRLVTSHSFKMDQRVSLRLPRTMTDHRSLSLPGHVARIGPASRHGGHDVCVIFEEPSFEAASLLENVIEMHASGPAIFPGRMDAPPPRRAPPPDEEAITSEADEGVAKEEDATRANRRATPRHSLERRVIALGDEAARVVLGRDISLHGMRVDPSPALAPGDKLQIAVHTPLQTTPLVLRALVDRDDAERGLVLQFVDVTPQAEARLREMLQPLPELPEAGNAGEEAEEPSWIVSQILERTAAED